MPFTAAKTPPPPPPPGTGVSLSLTYSKAGQGKVRLSLRDDLQHRVFGGPIAGQTLEVQIGRGADEGRLKVTRVEDGPFLARPGIRGTATIWIAAWDLLPNTSRKTEPCKVLTSGEKNALLIELPSFCRPSAKGGSLEGEFGLKRSAGGRRGQS